MGSELSPQERTSKAIEQDSRISASLNGQTWNRYGYVKLCSY